jgi:hypothetical protein
MAVGSGPPLGPLAFASEEQAAKRGWIVSGAADGPVSAAAEGAAKGAASLR